VNSENTTCGEATESKTKVHSYENDECKCGHEKEHKHENGIKYIYEDENNHIVRTYCKDCDEVISEEIKTHEFVNGKCVCEAEEELKKIIYYRVVLMKKKYKR